MLRWGWKEEEEMEERERIKQERKDKVRQKGGEF